LCLSNSAPEKEFDAEGALVWVGPIANFTHNPSAELVEPLNDVDDVTSNNVLHKNVTISLLCAALRSNKMLRIALSFFNQLVRISSWALHKRGANVSVAFFTSQGTQKKPIRTLGTGGKQSDLISFSMPKSIKHS
jgi:hypothetical protein